MGDLTLRVVVTNDATGELLGDRRVPPGNEVVLVTEPLYVHSVQESPRTGTKVITLRRRKPEPAPDPFAGTGFHGGICICHASGGRLKKRYLKQADAMRDARVMPKDAWVYPCPAEKRVWHVTTHPIEGGQYVQNEVTS